MADQVRPKLPKLTTLMDDAEPDMLPYMTFLKEHRTKLHSTNPIERLNGEIKRRTEVVGIFPNDPPSPDSWMPSSWNKAMSGRSSGRAT